MANKSSTALQTCRLCGERGTVFSSLRGWLCAAHRDTLVYDDQGFAGSDDSANPGGAVRLVDAAGATGQVAEGGSPAPGPVPSWNGIPKGSIWQRLKDGKHYEVVFGHEGWRNHFTGYERPPRIQLRIAGAQNLKSTHWIDPENLRKLYRRAA